MKDGGILSAGRFLTREPSARLPAVLSVLIRVPMGAMALVLPPLSLSLHMSPTVAATSLGLCRVGQMLSGPVWGRLVDRFSMRLVVTTAGPAWAATIALIGIVPLLPWSMLMLLAVTVGALSLPMNALMRALWSRTLGDEQNRLSANSFESIMAEAVLLIGRLLVAASVVVLPLRVVVLMQAAMVVIGTTGLAACQLVRSDRAAPGSAVVRRTLHSWSSTAGLMAVFFLTSASLGAFSFVLLLGAGGYGQSDAAVALAAWGGGSIIGLAILRLDRVAVAHGRRGSALLMVAMALTQLLSGIAHLPVGWLVLVGFLAGLPIAAVMTGLYAELDRVIDPARRSESFAWATTMLFAGDACGAFLAGFVLQHAASAILAATVAAVCAALAALSIMAPRHRIRRQERATTPTAGQAP